MGFLLLTAYILAGLQLSCGLEGRLFYLTFMNTINLKNSQDYPTLQEIFITSSETGVVTIKYGYPLNHKEIFVLNEDNKWQWGKQIDPTNICPPFNKISNSAIIISSTVDISVQVNKADVHSGGEGYLALPVTENSKRFYLASYSSSDFSNRLTEFAIISLYNDTTVTAIQSNKNILRITLSESEVYQKGSEHPDDYTGLYVTSSRPVAVFSGHGYATIPSGIDYGSHIVEQIPPVSQWGKTFIMASFHGRPYAVGFIVRVIAQSDITVTYSIQKYDNINSPLTFERFRTSTIEARQWDEMTINDTRNSVVVLINCSADCLVMQYNLAFEVLGKDSPGETSRPAPFMITVPSLDHYTNNVRFSTCRQFNNVSSFEHTNGLTIVVKTTEINNIYLDGKLITSIGGKKYTLSVSNWSNYSVIIAALSPGFHSVITADPAVKYAVFVYGHGTRFTSSYGYLAGYGYIYGDNDRIITETKAINFPSATTVEAANHAITTAFLATTDVVIIAVAGIVVIAVTAIIACAVVSVKRRRNALAADQHSPKGFETHEFSDLSNFGQNYSRRIYSSAQECETDNQYQTLT